MEALEKIVQFDEQGSITLKLGRHFSNKEAKVVILIKEDDITDEVWMKLAMKTGAYDFWNDPSEDIYTIQDGEPYNKNQNEI